MTSNQYTPYAPYSSYNYHYGQSSTEPYPRHETTSASNIASQTSSHHPPMNPIFLPNPANSSSYRALSPSHHMQDSGYGWGREKAGSASSWEPQQSQPQYQHQQYNYSANSSTAPEVQPTTENQPWLDNQRQRGDHRGEQRGEREQQQGLLMLGEAATAVTGEQTRINEDNTAEITTRTPSQAPGERRKSKADQQHEFTGAGTVSASGTRESPADEYASLEAEMRAMMARMRELNGRDPALVSRIWEEERRKKTPTPKTPTQAHVQAIPAQPVQTAPPSTSNRATTTRAKETGTAETGKGKPPAQSARSTRPAPSAPTVPSPRSAPPAATPVQEIPTSATPFGRVWPMEKNPQLAVSVWKYITSHKQTDVNSSKIFSILETKPSYVEFCERLEGMGLQIDRTILLNQMLEAVPAVVPVAAPYVKAALSQPDIKNGSISQPSVPVARMEALNPAGERRPNSLSSAPVASTEPTKLGPKSPSGIAPVSLPLAPMEPTKMGSNAPTSKAEAAKMRSFNEIIDLTQVSDEIQSGRPSKKPRPLSTPSEPTRHADSINTTASKSANPPATPRLPIPATIPPLVDGSRAIRLVEVIDYKKSLRRNEYDVATIARDVLIASGRHPDERPLNEHLVILKQHFPSLVTNDADLSTLRWDLLDPESPPWGYGQGKRYHVIGGEDSAQSRLPASAIKRGKRGRPPQQQPPATSRLPNSTDMNEPRQPDSSIGYKAFTPTLYGPDGKPLPKKRGRPFGWRKAIHGSPAAQANTTRPKKADALQEQPSQPTSIHNATGSNNVPTFVGLSSTLVSRKTPPYHSFKCKWQDCKAELHNLETLKKHVYKIHGKQKFGEQNECLWEGCSNEVAIHDFKTNMIIDRVVPKIFLDEGGWREHMEEKHLKPLSWELGDGPAGGLSDAHDSESYLSDAQGRRVTPRLSVDPDGPSRGNFDTQDPTISDTLSSIPRGRGRTPRTNQERDAREAQQRLISQKKRIGGPGMDRGGATLVNDKRRKGFSDHEEAEEELVDADT